jgi:hypothetical protein
MSAVVSNQLPRMVRVWSCPVEEVKVAVALLPITVYKNSYYKLCFDACNVGLRLNPLFTSHNFSLFGPSITYVAWMCRCSLTILNR